MLNRVRTARFVWSLLAVAVSAGCASQQARVKPVAMERNSSSDTTPLEGVWEGEVWEMPTHYIQGVRRVTLKIAKDGSWTATSGGTQCASGTASVRGGLVILGGTRAGPDYCMPYSVASNDGRMKAVFETSFKARPTSAMIGLDPVAERLPEAAQAPSR
jgi:hypothetical protein